MAVRYAIATGNWSNPAIWNGGTLPTSADDVYSNNFTVTIDQNITVISVSNKAQSPAMIGGQFIINDGANVILTSPINGLDMYMSYTYPSLIVYNGTSSCSITATFATNYGYVNVATNLITTTNSGTLNLLGDYSLSGLNNFFIIGMTGMGTLNFTGNIKCQPQTATIISRFATMSNASATIYITGTIDTTSSVSVAGNPVFGTLAGKLYIVGNITTGVLPIISSSESNYLSIIGTVSNDAIGNFTSASAVYRSSSTATNIFSGPFICNKYGYMPIQCTRMHLIPSTSNYFEFRDETTNGALFPGAIAPASRLVSPATLVDNLAPSDVRFGTSYALGTLTGTLRMPVANQVTFGVQVDNTFGNAVLTADGIWNYLVTNLNTPDSIGMRLKNVSTPQTTGEQLEAFLRLD
jgi:hypothetical protein